MEQYRSEYILHILPSNIISEYTRAQLRLKDRQGQTHS